MLAGIRPILSYETLEFKATTYISQQYNGSPMFHLILVIANIALSLAFLQATMSYSPWWTKSANDVEHVIKHAGPKLEQAFTAITQLSNGTPPPVVEGSIDGGLWNNFGSALGLPPAAPNGFTWRYGQHKLDDSLYSGMHYFCLHSTEPLNEGSYRGVLRAKAIYGADQAFFSPMCGLATEMHRGMHAPNQGALTIYVTYIPGLIH